MNWMIGIGKFFEVFCGFYRVDNFICAKEYGKFKDKNTLGSQYVFYIHG